MNYLITYDISDDKERTKIGNVLEDYGMRVQKSVFECWFDSNNDLNKVIKELKSLIKGEGNIRIYPLCKSCFEKSIGIGEFKKDYGEDGYIIF